MNSWTTTASTKLPGDWGSLNPIHWDPEFRLAGNPMHICLGLGTLSMCVLDRYIPTYLTPIQLQ